MRFQIYCEVNRASVVCNLLPTLVYCIYLSMYICINICACPAVPCGSVFVLCTRSELVRASVACGCGRPPGTGSVRGRAGPRRLSAIYTALCTLNTDTSVDTRLITLGACLMCAVTVSRRPRSHLNT